MPEAQMNSLAARLKERTFEIWEFKVSLGSLLIRSPKGESRSHPQNIDLIYMGVDYMCLPKVLHGLEIVEANSEEVSRLEEIFVNAARPDYVHVLASNGHRFQIVASFFKIDENEDDIFTSPFNW